MRGTLALLTAAALLLSACGNTEPPSVKVTGVIEEVRPMSLAGNSTTEITVLVSVRNTTASDMWLLPRDFWYHPGGAATPIRQASALTPLGNESVCSGGPVRPGSGISCRLYFAWSDWVPLEALAPGWLRWADGSGYSHRDANGSAWVEEWVGFTPPAF